MIPYSVIITFSPNKFTYFALADIITMKYNCL